MSNLLVLGVGPLPIDRGQRIHAPGIRVWHLASLLAAAGNRVVIGAIEFGDFQDSEPENPRSRAGTGAMESVADRINVFRMRYHSVEAPRRLAALHVTCQFDGVVATSDIMNAVAADIPANIPLWLDLLGDPFTERQIQAAAYGSDAAQLDQWRLMSKALIHGDRFSAASTPQKNVLIGQLGFAGRLNQFTAGVELVHVLPNCRRLADVVSQKATLPLRGRQIPQDCFLLLWAGGYNTWCDPDTLFEGVEGAMKEAPDLVYVSAGGDIPGHDNLTFRRFKTRVDASPLSKRFFFLGWLPNENVPDVYRQADAALNVDLDCYEAEIGTRTRIIDWVQFKVPVITTALCEPARKMADEDLVEPFEVGNSASLTRAILKVYRNKEEAKRRAVRAEEFFNREFQEAEAFAPLLEWAHRPVFAPDRNSHSRNAAISPPQEQNVAGDLLRTESALAAWHETLVSSLTGKPDSDKQYTPLLIRAVRKLGRILGGA